MRVCIIMPAHNEEKRIGKTLENYENFFKELVKKKKIDYKIIIIINGTKDKTASVVEKYSKKNRNISYLDIPAGGKGNAVKVGFKEALRDDFDLIGFVDADLATYPEEFWKLVNKSLGVDGAFADRYMKESEIIPAFSFRRIVVSKVFNFIVRSLLFMPPGDTQCGAKIFKRHVVEKVIGDLTITQWAFDMDLLYSCKRRNFKIVRVPTIWFEVEGGSINLLKSSIGMFFSVIQLRILKSPFSRFLKILNPIVNVTYKIIKG